jgi:nicotinate-nucleotide adenylyltransferase
MSDDPTALGRVGIFGGTFDPFHMGHLVVAQDVAEVLELDRMIFIPAGVPPHKPVGEVSPAPLRWAMVRAGIGDDPRFAASDLELRRPGPSYTVDTLRQLREQGIARELFFLMGSDQLAEFHRWREPEEVGRLATLVVMAREGDDPTVSNPRVEVAPVVVPVTRIDLSATRVRNRVREGRSIRYLVPDPVRRIILDERLYTGADPAPAS